MDYKTAGVDVEAGRAFVQKIRSMVDRTRRPEVLGGLGGFSGLFQLPAGYRSPVLVSGTDGVGTKLKLAQQIDRHDTVGIDLVAMCVNDVLTCGAEPLFFLDYLATGKLQPEQLAQVVSGIAIGCEQAGCALLGGETAEMPGFYQPGEYDLAGFAVGIVEKDRILDSSRVQIGARAIGLASSGVHSNGFSLVRKIIEGHSLTDAPFGDRSLAEELLQPTRIYVQSILAAQKAGLEIHAMAHITGGGLPENLPRSIQADQAIAIDSTSWPIPPVFAWLESQGVSRTEMFNTFNMGIGFVLLVPPDRTVEAIDWFANRGESAWAIGEVVSGSGELHFT